MTIHFQHPEETDTSAALETERSQLAALSLQVRSLIDAATDLVDQLKEVADKIGDAKERRSEAARKANATRKERKEGKTGTDQGGKSDALPAGEEARPDAIGAELPADQTAKQTEVDNPASSTSKGTGYSWGKK